MDTLEVLLLITSGMTVVLAVLYPVVNFYYFKPHKTSFVISALLNHFEQIKEQPMEFRITEAKAKTKNREFEVKTIHQKYYRIVITNLKVEVADPIKGFSIGDQDWYMRGVVDPYNLNKFAIDFKENQNT